VNKGYKLRLALVVAISLALLVCAGCTREKAELEAEPGQEQEQTIPEKEDGTTTEEENQNGQEEMEHRSKPAETVTITLYFADRKAVEDNYTGKYDFLAPVQRTYPHTKEVLNLALCELIKGPGKTENHLGPVMPSTTRILGISIENGVAAVNLSSEVLTDSSGGTLGGSIFMNAMVLTATEFPTVNSVQVLVEGEDWCDGHVVWDKPLGRNDLNF